MYVYMWTYLFSKSPSSILNQQIYKYYFHLHLFLLCSGPTLASWSRWGLFWLRSLGSVAQKHNGRVRVEESCSSRVPGKTRVQVEKPFQSKTQWPASSERTAALNGNSAVGSTLPVTFQKPQVRISWGFRRHKPHPQPFLIIMLFFLKNKKLMIYRIKV